MSDYYNQGRHVCKRGQVPINIAICENTGTAKEVIAALNTTAINTQLKAALERADALCRIALPTFDWGKSALTAEAIQLLNEVPGEITAALKAADGEGE